MSNKEAVYRVLSVFNKYKLKSSILIVLFMISAIFSIITPLITRLIIDEGLYKEDYKIIVTLSILCLCFVIIDQVINLYKESIRIKIKTSLINFYYKEALNNINSMSLERLNKISNTEMLNNLQQDISGMSLVVERDFFQIITNIFNIIGGLMGLFIISWKLTLVILLFIPIKSVLSIYISKNRRSLIEKRMKYYSNFSKWFGESILGIRDIKTFNIFDKKMEEFDKIQSKIIDIDNETVIQVSKNNMIDQILIQFIVTLIYILSSSSVLNLNLSVGSILVFITYSMYSIKPIASLFNLSLVFSSIIPSTIRYYEFLNKGEEIHKEEFCNKVKFEGDFKEYPRIEYNNICFSYDKDNVVLNKLNFEIEPFEKVAILGNNGVGKSTIINLLMRFYTPTNGSIKINNMEINEFDINSYRKEISIVSQNAYLFNDTIRNNICMYKNIDQEYFNKVIEDCNLVDLYKNLGEHTKIGHNGNVLSGGQRQKILIARAIINNSSIIIFDEATSNLDIETEEQINKMLIDKLKDKTVIVVAHRKSILRYIDKVITISEGKASIKLNDNKIKYNKELA